MTPKVAIIGRANVGKSTLFNRLVERQKALVSQIPGTTRDRNEADCLWRGKIIRVIDTGGLDVDPKNEIEADIAKQARLAQKEAEVILFVVDAKSGMMPLDQDLAREMARSKKPVIPVLNKVDSVKAEKNWTWPLAQPRPVSATRGTGVGDLLDEIYDTLGKINKPPAEIVEAADTRIAVIGKPNVGKSSLINKIAGEERFIVSPVAHTTREPNDTLVEIDGKSYVMIDTAGIRKLAKVKKSKTLEASSVQRSLDVLKRADLTFFVIDISKKLTTQDKALAGMIIDSNSGVIIVANKWDLIEDKYTNSTKDFTRKIHMAFPFFTWAPIMFVSAKSGQRTKKLFDLVDQVQKARYTEIPVNELNEFFKYAIRKHQPSRGKGAGQPTLLRIKQTGVAPPRFEVVLRGRWKESLNPSYLRYLEKQLRERFDLVGTPIKIKVVTSK